MTMTRLGVPVLALAVSWGCGRGSDSLPIVASGHVEATEVRVPTKVGGVISRLSFDEGAVVKAGQTLAEIDPVDIRLALAATRGERDQAAADLKLRVAGSRAEDVAEAEAQVSRAAAELDGADKDLERMQGLLASGSGTTKGRDDAGTRRDMARAGLESARERLRKLKTGSRPEEIEAARARLSAGEARLAQLEQQLKDATIVSPVAGVVTEKLVEQGELASRGTALAVVTDLADAWLTVYLAETDLGRIRIGQPVEVTTDDGQKREGTVSFVASQAEFTPKNVQTRDERVKLVYRVKVRLPNEDGLFKPGMPAEARLSPTDKRP
jgi:HlyD family secretion protein